MATVTLASLCDSIASTVAAAADIEDTQKWDELTEGMNTLPCLQVYPSAWNQDDLSGVSQSSFRGGVKRSMETFVMDIYARQRSDLITDMKVLINLIDQINAILDGINTTPYFGDDNIRQFHYSGNTATLEYAGVSYAGARYTLEVWVF